LGRRGICYGMLKGGEGSFGAAGVFSKVADFFSEGAMGARCFLLRGRRFGGVGWFCGLCCVISARWASEEEFTCGVWIVNEC